MEGQILPLSLNAMTQRHNLFLNSGAMFITHVEGYNYDLSSRINNKQRN